MAPYSQEEEPPAIPARFRGGPFNSSYVLLMMVYREAFQLNNGGYASAVALVLFVIIMVVSVLQFQLLRIGGRK